MNPILSKKQMTEEDIKLQYITPAITSKWDIKKITMEPQITDGRINLKGNFVFREKPKRADYLLYLNDNNPIAVIEAKDNNHSISHGLQQAMTYAQMLDLPFAYSSNGDGFAEHDFLTGTEREIAMDEFPTENELIMEKKGEGFRRFWCVRWRNFASSGVSKFCTEVYNDFIKFRRNWVYLSNVIMLRSGRY